MRNLLLIIEIFFILLFNNTLYSQEKGSDYLNKEIAELVLRLDTIYSHVQFDTNLIGYLQANSKTYPLNISIVNKWLLDKEIHKQSFVQLDYHEVLQYLPPKNVSKNIWKRDGDSIQISNYCDKNFKEIANQIFEDYNNKIISYDSLNYLNTILHFSTHDQLANKKFIADIPKRFVIHGILEFEKYYLIYYHLIYDVQGVLGDPHIEVVFK